MVCCRLLCVAIIFAFTPFPAATQENAKHLNFEVASIRLHDPSRTGGIRGVRTMPGGHGYTAVNVTVRLMISVIYRVPEEQIKGGPDWIARDLYDVEASADGNFSNEDLHTMYQHLLEDRFGLKFHTETRNGPAFVLTVEPSGSKMKATDKVENFQSPIVPVADLGDFAATRVSMPYFAWYLGQNLLKQGKPVLDQTGLAGFYEFKLRFQPNLPPDVSPDTLPPDQQNRPGLIQALKEQLGLRLKAQTGPIEYYIIDKLDRPTPN